VVGEGSVVFLRRGVVDVCQASQGIDLGAIAGAVVARVRPNGIDRESRDDCFQTAYLSGLQACATARRAGRRPAAGILFKQMRRDVYRLLHKRRGELRESDLFRP
jgi:hypothetical protein